MNRIMVRIMLAVALVTVGVGVYIYFVNSSPDPVKAVQYIYKRYDPTKRVFNDMTNELGFDGLDSLGYDQIDNETVRIRWGNNHYAFDIKVKDLENEELMKMLNRMGMTIDLEQDEETKTNTFIVKYRGDRVAEYDLQVGGNKWRK